MSGDPFEKSGHQGRRIGRRVPTPDLVLDWQPDKVPGRKPWQRRARPNPQALVVDLSITGARVEVRGGPPLPVGTRVTIGLDGAAGACVVRRCEQRGDSTLYGVQFTHLGAALTSRINSLIADDDGTLEERWRRAR